MKNIFKINSYLASLSPLFCYVIVVLCFPIQGFGLKGDKYNPYQFIALFFFSFILIESVLYTICKTMSMLKNKSDSNVEVVIKDVKKINDFNYTLVVQNVLPVVSLVFNLSYPTVIFTVLILFFLGVIWIRNDLYYQNIIFEMAGLKVYNADIAFCIKGTRSLDKNNLKFDSGYIIAKKGNPIAKLDLKYFVNDDELPYISARKTSNTVFYISDF